MLGALLEKHHRGLIVAFSVLILLGSGISLGVGLTQLGNNSPEFQTKGFTQGGGKESISAEELPSFPININTATAVQLEQLPGIGPSKAQAIVDYREKNGRFQAAAEIQNVSGIGPKTYERIKEQITIE